MDRPSDIRLTTNGPTPLRVVIAEVVQRAGHAPEDVQAVFDVGDAVMTETGQVPPRRERFIAILRNGSWMLVTIENEASIQYRHLLQRMLRPQP